MYVVAGSSYMIGGPHNFKLNSLNKNPRSVQLIIMRQEIPSAECCWLDWTVLFIETVNC